MRAVRGLPIVAALVFATGCEDTTGVTILDLVGTWNATKVEFVSTADATVTFDLIANGLMLSTTINSDGTYSGSFTLAGQPPDSFSGTMTVQGTTLVFTEPGEQPDTAAFTLEGNTLTITDTNEKFDFDFDGIEEDATVTTVMVRQ